MPRLLLCLLLLPLSISAQQQVFGTVTGIDGYGLIGATVRLVGTGQGTVTDLDGKYSLTVPDRKGQLEFSYTGMKTVLSPVAAVVDVVLREDAAVLREVTVTAYRGEQAANATVGSYATITETEQLAERPVESIDKLLDGQIAGVQVEINTGEPGLPVSIQIRGQGSIPNELSRVAASTQPLFVLDGVPLFDVSETNTTNSVFSDLNNQRLNPLTFLNPDDIESITVLKDASAAALYGSDASNGVILITTKKGAGGQMQVNLSASYGLAQTINEIKFLNTPQWLELARETAFNSGLNPASAGDDTYDTDWRGIVRRTAKNADVDLSISGGKADGLRYRVSAGYNVLESLHQRNGLESGSLSGRLDWKISNKLSVNTRLSLGQQRKDNLGSFGVFTFVPNISPFNEDGTGFNTAGTFQNRINPLAQLEQNENALNSNSLNGVVGLTYRPIPSLTVRGLYGLDRIDNEQRFYNSALNLSGFRRNGRLVESSRDNASWVSNGQMIWEPKTKSKHHPSALLGGELRRQENTSMVASGVDFPNDEVRDFSAIPEANISRDTNIFEQAKASWYGELAYDYDFRYFLKLNARRDATSIFGGDQQAGLFYAIGTAWNFSEESFWQRAFPGITNGRLGISYGITGNSRLGIYTTGGLYQRLPAETYGGLPTLTADDPANPLLGWERKRQLNFSLKFNLFQDALSITAEYYRNKTIDGLLTINIPSENGFSSVVANASEILNQGPELSLTYRSPTGKKVSYTGSLNLARNFNRLVTINLSRLGTDIRSNGRLLSAGLDFNLVYGIPSAGVDPQTGEQRWELASGEITTDAAEARKQENFVVVGRSAPTVIGGGNHTLSVGAFSITALLKLSLGSSVFVDPLTFTDGRQISFNNQSVNQLDRWQQPGDLTDVPRLRVDNRLVSNSDRYLYDLDFLQIASISLRADLQKMGVTLPGTRSLSVYALVNNVAYFYNDDTPKDRNGVAEYRFRFPEQRAFVMGIKVGW